MKTGVYILKSLRNQRYYIGSSKNVEHRFGQHNAGRVKATHGLLPLELVAFLPCETVTEARSAERRLKNYKRRDIIELVIGDKKFPWEHLRA
ncbi:MAG: hypothetical protein A2Y84_00295 [Candidatus Colwellbacteria bacterium RBG_13_48_8]|uniref:GIY-YIG domain-containing protein n=1 Tax=Candidatus Colwellbacteria bacterium RBG_13_48_8 TaxID=1797685 RepID=A0A1G1YXL1_9BACT|nr:MAG: hypothetical protein A2Y84_00295 [Candidatus Colwellbacteria bacterium RBG_13_48_8]